jgi:hypothetical protein
MNEKVCKVGAGVLGTVTGAVLYFGTAIAIVVLTAFAYGGETPWWIESSERWMAQAPTWVTWLRWISVLYGVAWLSAGFYRRYERKCRAYWHPTEQLDRRRDRAIAARVPSRGGAQRMNTYGGGGRRRASFTRSKRERCGASTPAFGNSALSAPRGIVEEHHGD